MSWMSLPYSMFKWLLVVIGVGAILLTGIQMLRGDALVCADGAIFAKTCTVDGYLREFAAMERSPGGEMNLDNTINDPGWGRWSNWAYCPENHYVCGLSQRVFPPAGSDVDDTAMAGIKFKCCPLIPDTSQ